MRGPRFGTFGCILLLTAITQSGCVDLTRRSATQLSPLQPQEQLRYTRQGHAYCILGWLGIWSRGIDVIAQRTQTELGVHATSLANQEWRKLVRYLTVEHEAGRWNGPLVLVGHSYGCDDQVRVWRAASFAETGSPATQS